MENQLNRHMWIPNLGPELFDEVCNLCGIFSGGHQHRPDPSAGGFQFSDISRLTGWD
jgi:hypothetical protein